MAHAMRESGASGGPGARGSSHTQKEKYMMEIG